MRITKAWILLPLLTVGACAHDREFGKSVSDNVAAQAVDMSPKYAGVPMEGSNGRRSIDAYRRYLEGTVKKPDATGSRNASAGGQAPQ